MMLASWLCCLGGLFIASGVSLSQYGMVKSPLRHTHPSSGMSSTNAAICSGVCLSIKTQKIGVPSLDKAIATAPKSVKPTTALASSSRRRTSVHARGEAASKIDRAVSAAAYLVPLLDGLRYSKFLLRDFPQLAAVFVPLTPLIKLYLSVPYAGLILFFVLYFGIAQNRRFSRFARFNGMQAILLDVVLNVPALAERFLLPAEALNSSVGLWLFIQAYNTVFLYLFVSALYGSISSIMGKAGRIPLIANAAEASSSNF
ncbi:hypothetical protein AAMO2058_000693300 [Amorphochlora amoebiformis]